MMETLTTLYGWGTELIKVLTPLMVAIVTIWLPIKLRRQEQRLTAKVDEAKEAVTNSHETHLRDDLDSKFNLLFAKMSVVFRKTDKLAKAVVAQRNDIADLYTIVAGEAPAPRGEANEDSVTRELRNEIGKR